MKTIYKSLLMLLAAVALVSIYSSCKKDDLPNGGEPRIRYVRVTNPGSSDSLLIGAGQGSTIAIIGENLQDAVELWFNDQRANLNPTYITSTNIIVVVPSVIPKEITNTLRIIFSNGKTLEHQFEVQISEPLVSSMLSEYVKDGDIATIRGDFFYEPLEVTFSGGVKGELVSVQDQQIQVRVPEGAQVGPITVKTNFGQTASDFWFRDNRNIFISSDPYEGWWNSSFVVTDPGPNDPEKINGNYIRVVRSVSSWPWLEIAGGPGKDMPIHSKNIPDAAILKPEDYNFKFEVNTLKPYNANMIMFNVGLIEQNNNAYKWAPPYDTKGQWQTVVIPFEEMVASYGGGNLSISKEGYWSRVLMHGEGDLDVDIAFDNFRVVPKVNK